MTHGHSSSTRQAGAGTDAGFSLVEMLIALVVTLIVSGAVFALIAGGNNAFRREPELSDRQQNIRAAMSLITRDVANAGVDLGPWAQAFTRGDGAGGAAPLLDGAGPQAPSGNNSDFLEIFGNDGSCPGLPVDCRPSAGGGLSCGQGSGGGGGGSSVVLNLALLPPACYRFPTLLAMSWPPKDAADPGFGIGLACSYTTGGPAETHVVFPPGVARDINWPRGGELPTNAPATVATLQAVRYEIRVAADGVPELWRSNVGNVDFNNCPGGGGGGGVPDPWQVVARGIEDLQVLYTMADGALVGVPAVVVKDDYRTLVREVQITLVARVMKQRLQGERAGAGATGQFVRASLTSSVTPRAALMALRDAPAAGPVTPWN